MIEYYKCEDCGYCADSEYFPIDDVTEHTICGRCHSEEAWALEIDEVPKEVLQNTIVEVLGEGPA